MKNHPRPSKPVHSHQKRRLGTLGFVKLYKEKLMKNPLAQLALFGGAMTIAITSLVICFDFKGSIDIQVGPQGGRLTIDSRQPVDSAEPPTLQASKKK